MSEKVKPENTEADGDTATQNGKPMQSMSTANPAHEMNPDDPASVTMISFKPSTHL